MPVAAPYGAQRVVQISSMPGLVGLVFLFVLIGWVVGGLYFRWVSGTALGEEGSGYQFRAGNLPDIYLIRDLVHRSDDVIVPVLLVLTALALISPALANGALFVMLMLSFWLIVPLFFTPHGIFVRRQNAFYSILHSLRMARFTLPTSGMFVLECISALQRLELSVERARK